MFSRMCCPFQASCDVNDNDSMIRLLSSIDYTSLELIRQCLKINSNYIPGVPKIVHNFEA